MVEEQFLDFDWDDGNIHKSLLKHGLSRDDIEDLFRRGLSWFADERHSVEEERYLGIGQDLDGRYLIASFTFRWKEGRRLARPISVRHMHQKEIKRHEQHKEGR